jgi:hypothetical protein
MAQSALRALMQGGPAPAGMASAQTAIQNAAQRPQPKPMGQQVADVLGGVALPLSTVPVVGDVAGLGADAAMYANYPEERTALNYGLTLAGMLPFVPGAAGVRAAEGALDMSQAARMQRAQDMGFEPTTYYHGTSADFDSFDPSMADPSRRGSVFISDNPAVASTYARSAGSKNVMPLMIRPERPVQIYAGGANWNKLQGDTVVELPARTGPPDESDVLLAELRGVPAPTSQEYPASRSTLKELFPEVFRQRLDGEGKLNTNDLSRWAQYQGADSLIFHDIVDVGPTFLKDEEAFKPSKNVVMFEPEKIRSAYAEFDPTKRGSANLSAGIMGGAVGLSALRQLIPQQEQE